MESLIQDLRYAARSFTKSPLFTIAVLLCLGVGIGINGAAFSIVHGFLFRSLPYASPAELVVVDGVNADAEVTDGPLVWADLEALRATGALSDVGAFYRRDVNLTGGDRPERVQSVAATPGLFPLLGVEPQLGRPFTADEGAPAGFEQSVLISDRLWRRSFGADPGVIGRPVEINDRALTVVGVMPPGFRFPEIHDLWLPLASADPTDRAARAYSVIGRRAAGVSEAAAAARIQSLSVRLAADHPDSHRRWRFGVRPIREAYLGEDASRQFMLMMLAVSLVLVIACVNVANLLLARSAQREPELGLRSALGAGRRRLLAQLLTESVLLAAGGAIFGAGLATWMVALLVGSMPPTEDFPHWVRIGMDGTVLGYMAAIAAGTVLVFGLMPALRASRVDLSRGFRSGSARPTRALDALVGLEVALALTLLLPAGLLLRSFLALGAADPGFETDRILTARLVLSGDRYDESDARAAFYQDVADRMEADPGVESVAWTGAIPADDGGLTVMLVPDGGAVGPEGLAVQVVPVTGGYFETLGLDLPDGRGIRREEARQTTAGVVVVNRRLAERLWPDGAAVGRTVRIEGEDALRVVGVAPDLQYEEFGEAAEADRLQLHVPYGLAGWRSMALVARTRGEPGQAASVLTAALREADPNLPLFEILSMRDRLRATRWGQQLMGRLFAVYGAAALFLALAGIYGVMAYNVSRRRAEIGVRMALGADRAQILRSVAGRGLVVTLAGAAAGTVGAVLAARAFRGMLFDVTVSDPVTYIGVLTLMIGASLAAAILPARSATRASPVDALRVD